MCHLEHVRQLMEDCETSMTERHPERALRTATHIVVPPQPVASVGTRISTTYLEMVQKG